MNDYVLIFCFLLPGAALLILGIYNAVKIYSLKEIASFRLMEDSKIVHFSKPGTYCLIVAGGNTVKQLPLRIVSQVTGKGIDAYSVVPAPRSFKKGSIAITYCRFVIEDAGPYEIIIMDYSRVLVERRFPGPVGLVANSTIPPAWLTLIVEEYASVFTSAKALMGTLIGLFLVMGSICFLLFNHGIITPSESETTTITTYTP
jgi:hypothetical protein